MHSVKSQVRVITEKGFLRVRGELYVWCVSLMGLVVVWEYSPPYVCEPITKIGSFKKQVSDLEILIMI